MFWVKILLIAVVVCAALWIEATRGRRYHPNWERFCTYQYAHRGLHNAARQIPENSMAAFRLAKEQGYGIELDVHLTADGNLAVIHDKSLKRTAGVDVEISQLTVAELKQYELEGTQEKIPLLEEVAELFQNGPPLLVELKADYFDVRELVAKTVHTLDQYQVNYCIESFHPGVLRWLMRHRPDICRGQLSQDFCRERGELKFWQAFCMTTLVPNCLTRPDFISFHHKHRWVPAVWLCRWLHGLPIFCWTVKDPQEMKKLEKKGYLIIFEGFVPNLEYQKAS